MLIQFAQLNQLLEKSRENVTGDSVQGKLERNAAVVCIVFGEDAYLLNEATKHIKTNFIGEKETHCIYTQADKSADWQSVIEQANHYGLFTEQNYIQVSFDKKNIDKATQKILTDYCQNPNPKALVLIQAPQLTAQNVRIFSALKQLICVQIRALNASEMQQWIKKTLQTHRYNYSEDVISTIYQFTQGNHLATAQLIEKLALTYPENSTLTIHDLQPHLTDQCHFVPFELKESCLLGNTPKTVHLIQQAALNKTEPSLILWILSQEIRLLIQLHHQMRFTSFSVACQQLKIWQTQTRLYDQALKKHSIQTLYQLLRTAQNLDESIKSNQPIPIWQSLTQLAKALSYK